MNDYKAVPVEPDDAMLDRAVAFALNVSLGGDYGWTQYMRDLWARFLSAVPDAPGGEPFLYGCTVCGGANYACKCEPMNVTVPLFDRPHAPSGEAVAVRELQPYQPTECNTLGDYLNRFGARQYTNGEIEFGSAMALDAMIQTIFRDCEIVKDMQRATRPPAAERLHTLDEWHEDIGPVLWWVLPIDEPPYCGEPLDDDWPGYHTHWTYITTPSQAAIDAARQGEGK